MNASSDGANSLVRRLRRKLQYSLYRQKWNIGITPHEASVVAGLQGDEQQRRALHSVTWMSEERRSFAADPFILSLSQDESHFRIFYEYFPWREGRGRIDSVVYRHGKFGASSLSFDSPYHLSYPHLFQDKGKYVLMPEHSEANDLSIYKLDEFGGIREKKTISGHLALVDSTMLFWQEKYWIFATHAGATDNSDLYIYFSDNLAGPWSMHAQNPVKQDRSNARPAGQFIHYAGSIFRPAQDCRSHYGSGIIINKLKMLTQERFEEQPVSEVRPIAGSLYDYGLHTISSAKGYAVIDGARMESSVHSALDPLGRYFR